MFDLKTGIALYVVFLVSVTVHEAAHAWVAMLNGDLTAYHGGQVSLNPEPHIRREPFGMVVLPILTVVLWGWPFGFAHAPLDPQWMVQHPRKAALVSLAGPVSNLLLMALVLVVLWICLAAGWFTPPAEIRFAHLVDAESRGGQAAALFLSGMFSLNLMLALLNIIPVPPLDGSGAVPLLLPEAKIPAYQQFAWGGGPFRFFGIFIAWIILDWIWQPVWLFCANWVHPSTPYGPV